MGGGKEDVGEESSGSRMMLQNLAQITNYSLEKGRNGSEEAYKLGNEWAELKRSS